MAFGFLKCNLRKCLLVSAVIIFMAPYYSVLLHSAGPYEHAQFAEAYEILATRLIDCDDPERQGAIAYTLGRYDRLGSFDVSVFHAPGCAGVNAPWCPGITIDPEFFDHPEILADLILHEAMHDYPPYLGHTQHKRLGIW